MFNHVALNIDANQRQLELNQVDTVNVYFDSELMHSLTVPNNRKGDDFGFKPTNRAGLERPSYSG